MSIYPNHQVKITSLFLVILTFVCQSWLMASSSSSSCECSFSCSSSSSHPKNAYRVKNIVSNLPDVARRTDPNLVNPWGLVVNAKGRLFVANNGTGNATAYKANGKIETVFSVDEAPTGVVHNASESDFLIGSTKLSAQWIFATETGQIWAINPQVVPHSAVLVADRSSFDSVYKGIAIAEVNGQKRLYATDFHNGLVDVFDNHFNFILSFTDANIPSGFAPFNIEEIKGKLYITYAKQDADRHDDVPGPGNGFVDIFETDGILVKRLISHGELNSPWGLALAPKGFGKFGKALLVGNFGDGHIHAYHPRSGKFLGQLKDTERNPIVIDGLWSIKFPHKGSDRNTLYFAAGLNDEADGLVGSITPHRE